MPIKCKYCGSTHVQSRGYRNGHHQHYCSDENHPEGVTRYFVVSNDSVSMDGDSSYETGDSFINIVLSSPRIMSEEDIINQFQVDTNKWRIESLKVKTSEGYRKDKFVDWHVHEGEVEGDSVDSGKMLVVPLFHIQARFVRKTEEIRSRAVLDDWIAEAKKYAPTYPKIKYPKLKDGLLLEIDMPDIHFGRLTWNEESGEDYDIQLASQAVHIALDKLLNVAERYPISKILLPIGNDFFNVNSKTNTTVHGTPQQEDTRWQKTFHKGRLLLQEVIDKCWSIAPVDVVVISGNHDEEKMFYMGEVIDAQYSANPDVEVDNGAKHRKYRQWGKNLIGFAHGYDEPLAKLPAIMANEAPEQWAQTNYREFHTGDKHRKVDVDENLGVVVRILRALTATDAWLFNSGYIGSLRAAEGFLWHPEQGLLAQFTATPY